MKIYLRLDCIDSTPIDHGLFKEDGLVAATTNPSDRHCEHIYQDGEYGDFSAAYLSRQFTQRHSSMRKQVAVAQIADWNDMCIQYKACFLTSS